MWNALYSSGLKIITVNISVHRLNHSINLSLNFACFMFSVKSNKFEEIRGYSLTSHLMKHFYFNFINHFINFINH